MFDLLSVCPADGTCLRTIFNEICKNGFKGSRTPFYEHYKYLSDGHHGYRPKNWKVPKGKQSKDERSALMPIKNISMIIGKKICNKTNSEEDKIIELFLSFDWFKEMFEAAASFYRIITGTDASALIKWMKQYWRTKVRTLKAFIMGIKLDYKAVVNTIRLNVTNGITEGFVNKLKAVKRTMYGRASIQLLKNKLVLEHIFFN